MGMPKPITSGLTGLLCCILSSVAFAGQRHNQNTGRPDFCVTVTEEDGSPSMTGCQTLEVTNGTLTDDADGFFSLSTGGGGGNSFETIAVPAGASVVAESSTDTLTLTETTFLTFTGTAATDTIDITQVTTDIGTDGLIAANAVALGTDTTNNYVATIADAGNANITVANSGSETAAVTLDVVDVTCTNCLTNVEVASADTVTTNANLTGDVTSVGNAATIADTVTVTGWVLGTSSATTFTSGTVNIDLLDGVGAVDMDYGSADITDHTFTTDGTGTAEIVLPAGSIDGTEILDDTVDSADYAANSIDDEHLATTESLLLPVQSAKLTGAFVVRTPTSGDASTQGAAIDAGDGNWRLLFDATTDEAAVWQFRLPDYWAAHSELNVFYTMTSATTLEVEFEADVMCVSDGDSADVGTAGFVGVAVGSATVPGTAGFPDEISITLTDDACAAGDMLWLYLSTDANDAANDDATGDREVIGVEYEFTR